VGALSKFILIENRLLSPSSVLEVWLIRIILQHYLRVGDLPIIVSHSFVAQSGCLSCRIYGPMFEEQSSIVGPSVATIT
jgi:hypothetical protein